MSEEQKKFFLHVDGRLVPVNEQVYREYHHYTRKEEYFTYDLKREGFTSDQETQTATFIPSREDSYDRLLEQNNQFAADEPDVEELAVTSVWLENLMQKLNQEERQIIYQRYVLGKTERKASRALRLSKTTFRRKHAALLKKLRKILEQGL